MMWQVGADALVEGWFCVCTVSGSDPPPSLSKAPSFCVAYRVGTECMAGDAERLSWPSAKPNS